MRWRKQRVLPKGATELSAGTHVEWWSEARSWPARIHKADPDAVVLEWLNPEVPGHFTEPGNFGRLGWSDAGELWGQVMRIVDRTDRPAGIRVAPVGEPRRRPPQRRFERRDRQLRLLAMRQAEPDRWRTMRTVDVSPKGCRVQCRVAWHAQDPVTVRWRSPSGFLTLQGRVAWVAQAPTTYQNRLVWEMGIAWTDENPPDVLAAWELAMQGRSSRVE